MKWTEKYKKAVAFSYDDGVYQDIRLVELLNKYGLKCTFNLNSGLTSPESIWYGNGVKIERMPPEMLPELYKGHEIASHSVKHRDLTKMDSHEIFMDIKQDIAFLENLFGCKISGFAYPFGATDDRVEDVLAHCGIKYARGVNSSKNFAPPHNLLNISPTCRHKDEDIFELARDFIELSPENPQIFLLWGHSYEFDMQQGWERFEKFCKLIAGHDDIYYSTCGEVFLNLQAPTHL